MPWEECHVMDERLRFVARVLGGEKMAALCAEFGVSRKTGYKILLRYQAVGVRGLTDRSRRPRLQGTPLTRPLGPNALWCADYKGEFLLGNRTARSRRGDIQTSDEMPLGEGSAGAGLQVPFERHRPILGRKLQGHDQAPWPVGRCE
jgi:hypothetical protein